LPKFGEAEIEQFDPGLGNQNIRGLEIPMRDALLMRRVERITNLGGILQRLI
jgi:hypothetical protein